MKTADEVLEGIFAAVISKARTDADFAASLMDAIGKELVVERPARPAKTVEIPADLEAIDLKKIIREEGRRAAQEALENGGFTIPQLRAYAGKHNIALRGAARKKSLLVSSIISAFAPPRSSSIQLELD